MSDSRLLEELAEWTTWHGMQAPAPVSAVPGECAIQAPDAVTGIGTPVTPASKRNHNRRPESTCKGRLPLTTAQKQEAIVLAAAGYAPSRVAKTMGKSRLMVKRHLEAPETIAMVRDEQAELVELYRQKARDCVAAIDDDKIAKASALQLATSSGILLDKSLLLSGQPTSINVVALMDVAKLIRERRDRGELARQQITDDGQ